MGEMHDSVRDARTSLYAASIILVAGPQAPIVRNTKGRSQLFVHRLPDYCTEEHLKAMIMQHTNVVPSSIEPIIRNPVTENSGKTNIIFTSTEHADLAFTTIAGPIRPDAHNKEQKRIYMKAGGYIYIRK